MQPPAHSMSHFNANILYIKKKSMEQIPQEPIPTRDFLGERSYPGGTANKAGIGLDQPYSKKLKGFRTQ